MTHKINDKVQNIKNLLDQTLDAIRDLDNHEVDISVMKGQDIKKTINYISYLYERSETRWSRLAS